jgi:hypothetical protein
MEEIRNAPRRLIRKRKEVVPLGRQVNERIML